MEKKKTVIQDLIEYWKIYLVENEENSEEELDTINFFIKQLTEHLIFEKDQIEDAFNDSFTDHKNWPLNEFENSEDYYTKTYLDEKA